MPETTQLYPTIGRRHRLHRALWVRCSNRWATGPLIIKGLLPT